MNFRNKMARFMYGRYGGRDQLNRFLWILIVILIFVTAFTRIPYFNYLALLLLVFSYYRMMSRNIAKRYAENQKYLKFTSKIRGKFFFSKQHFAQRKYYAFYRCKNCKQKVRVPKGKGRIQITCPKCKSQFIKTT